MPALLRRLLPKPVANTGSQLRDHHANERTFLSWTRMGLAFAAMGLAIGRLGVVEQMLNPQPVQHSQSTAQVYENNTETTSVSNNINPDLLASRLCQGISIWSFGYGLFRYLSVRRNLGRGEFVPAVWGPVVMTVGTLGVMGVLVGVDWKEYRGAKVEDRGRDRVDGSIRGGRSID